HGLRHEGTRVNAIAADITAADDPMMLRGIQSLVLALALAVSAPPAHAQLRGHGGAARAGAVSADGTTALSGSFDTSAIRWSLTRGTAEQVLRFHDDAVNAVPMLRDGRAVTAGADGRIAIWRDGQAQPEKVLEGHTAPIVALAV